MEQIITETFGKRLRVRVCGLLIENEQLLLIKHHYLGDLGYLWSPPGGGLQYTEKVEEALKREFLEETGLAITVHELAFVYEFFEPPLHAIELFFWVGKDENAGEQSLLKGTDPELPADQQIINRVAFLSLEALQNEHPAGLHKALQNLRTWQDLYDKQGYFTD
jgi:8-oxo-dGTP diphosphatase